MEMDTKTMDRKKLVLSFSGGCDSTVLLHMAAEQFDEIATISFDYGQRHKRELACAADQLAILHEKGVVVSNYIVDVGYINDLVRTSSLTNMEIPNPNINEMAGDAQPTSYVPFRNLMFLSICCSYAESIGADVVWYGATGVDSMAGYWDTDKHFIDHVNKLIGLNRKHKIQIEAPLIKSNKADIITEGVKLGVDFGKTWTCYASDEADVTTPSSSLRVKGFINAGFIDPIYYIQQEKINQLYKEHSCQKIVNNTYDSRIICA